MKKQIKEIVKKYIDIANVKYGKMMPMPTIVEMTRASTVAGKAYGRSWKVSFNHVLFAISPQEIDDTIGHEVAHIVDFALTGTMSHGPSWKRVMVDFGLPPNRTFSIAKEAMLIGKNTTVHTYECDNCGYSHPFGAKRHAKSQRGNHYTHNGCGGKMGYVASHKKHDILREKHGITTSTPSPRVRIPVAPKRTNTTTSKADIVKGIISNFRNENSSVIITQIMLTANMTKAGASTYFYKYR